LPSTFLIFGVSSAQLSLEKVDDFSRFADGKSRSSGRFPEKVVESPEVLTKDAGRSIINGIAMSIAIGMLASPMSRTGERHADARNLAIDRSKKGVSTGDLRK